MKYFPVVSLPEGAKKNRKWAQAGASGHIRAYRGRARQKRRLTRAVSGLETGNFGAKWQSSRFRIAQVGFHARTIRRRAWRAVAWRRRLRLRQIKPAARRRRNSSIMLARMVIRPFLAAFERLWMPPHSSLAAPKLPSEGGPCLVASRRGGIKPARPVRATENTILRPQLLSTLKMHLLSACLSMASFRVAPAGPQLSSR
jgi:hypothetical protein